MKLITRYLISVLIGVIIAFSTNVSLLYKFIIIVLVVLICQIVIEYILKRKNNVN